MAATHLIRLQGDVEVVRNERLIMVRLKNGHQVYAHAVKKDIARVSGLAVGQRVLVEMSPADMSRGRLRFEEQQ